MQEYERKQLLERIQREGAIVGASIPETIELDGEPFALREFVFEVKKRDGVPAEDRDRVDAVKKRLRRERIARKQRVENDDIDRETGERLVASVVGIDRALNALEQLGPTDLESEAEANAAADRKRWLNFLKQATGRDDSGRRGGV